VIIPFGIPGSGKTTFKQALLKVLDKLDWSFASVSSDEIRKEMMDKLIREKKIDEKEAFEKSGKIATSEYHRRAEYLLK
jgi:tRNA uridine 5-carbamoylmethylation protein Kti12